MTKTILPDKGERMVPEYHKGNFVYGEHMVRYHAALPLIKDKIVLDIACGSGYGTNMMAKTAKKVYGVDIDEKTIKYAAEEYSSKNIEFIKGSATAIPLEDSTVDVVATFETIEHIKDYKKFILEIKRVLKPGGLLILSTPNEDEFSEGNPFHVHEFTHKELDVLIPKNFKNLKIYYQATWVANGLLSERQLSAEWREKISVINSSPKPSSKAIYFYLLASDNKIKQKIEPILAISQDWNIRQQQEEQKQTQDHIRNLTEMREQAIKKAKQLELEIKAIKSSTIWKTRNQLVRLIGKPPV